MQLGLLGPTPCRAPARLAKAALVEDPFEGQELEGQASFMEDVLPRVRAVQHQDQACPLQVRELRPEGNPDTSLEEVTGGPDVGTPHEDDLHFNFAAGTAGEEEGS